MEKGKTKVWHCGYCRREYDSHKEADECTICHKDDEKTKREINSLNNQNHENGRTKING